MELYNKLGIELLYEELKGIDRAEYDALRNRYEKEYITKGYKTPFGNYWAKALRLVRTNHATKFKKPPIRETPFQRTNRLLIQKDPAKIAELKERIRRRTEQKI
jgi:hypothetical protein